MTTKLEAGERYALLVYDIPSNADMHNPSSLLRRFGARINLSCWVLPMKNLALVPMKEWAEKGATVEVVEFDEHEKEKVVALAKRAITRDLDEMRAFVEKLITKVRARFAATLDLPTGTTERAEALRLAESYAYASLYRAKGIADAAEEAALHFDLTGEVASLVESLRKGIKSRSALFFALQKEAREGSRGAAMRGESFSFDHSQSILGGI